MVLTASKTGPCQHRFDVDQAVLYDLLVNQLNDFAIFTADCDGCLQTWNPGVERLLGYAESEWLGQPIDIIFTPEDRQQGAPQEEMRIAKAHGSAPDIRWHQRQNGSRLFVEGTLVGLRDGIGNLVGFSKVMRDVTERKSAEESRANLLRELQDSEEFSRGILVSSPDCVKVMDLEGLLLSMNENGCRLMEIETLSVYLNQPWANLWEKKDQAVNAFQTAKRGFTNGFEGLCLTAKGTPKWWEVVVAPVRNAAGEPVRILSISRDITDRKLAEQERERLTGELQRSNNELAQFAHLVSHDLQAPIRGVMSFAQLLRRNLKEHLSSTDAEFFSHLIDSAASMQKLVESLLKFAQVGQGEINRQPVRMEAVLEAASQALSSSIEETGAIVEHTGLPTISGDFTLLAQLLQNLIGNAIKYQRPSKSPRVHIEAKKTGKDYLFTLQDNGVGIPEADLKDIFKPLKRLHSGDIPGSGLGLSTCQRIVERHGGLIWAESKGESGSTFYFTLAAE